MMTAACILTGNTLLAFLVAAFIIPNGIPMGGTTGIGIVLGDLFQKTETLKGLDAAAVILILNLLLLFLGWAFLGKDFFLTTVASSVLYPVLLAAFRRVPQIARVTDDATLAAIFAGILMGIALGLVMRAGSSTGGIDVVNLIFHHRLHLPLSVLVYVSDFIILAVQIPVVGFSDRMLLGILMLMLESLLLDRVMIAGKSQLQISVVSDRYREIRTVLLERLSAGVTMTQIETGRLGKRQQGVLCVIPPRKLHDAAQLIHTVDPDAFLTVTRINEVRGRGFTRERTWMPPSQANTGKQNRDQENPETSSSNTAAGNQGLSIEKISSRGMR